MKFSSKMYFGDEAALKKEKLLRKIRREKWNIGIYLILFFKDRDTNFLEIINTAQLLLPFSQDYKDAEVTGVASSYDEALEVVRNIVDDSVQQYGCVSVKELLLSEE